MRARGGGEGRVPGRGGVKGRDDADGDDERQDTQPKAKPPNAHTTKKERKATADGEQAAAAAVAAGAGVAGATAAEMKGRGSGRDWAHGPPECSCARASPQTDRGLFSHNMQIHLKNVILLLFFKMIH